ncbi:MAG: MBL fold metallo-hydrolase [Alicyclobacillus sp.]|nr:MBL fold metallo-hydrolase [Alicyclobacillus sp.]
MVYKQGEELIKEIHHTIVPESGAVALWHLGQAGLLLKGGTINTYGKQTILVVDPYLTYSIEHNNPGTEFVRDFPPPIRPADLAGVSAVLISHHHDDHMDIETLLEIHEASPGTSFIIPAPHKQLLLSAGISEQRLILARDGAILRINDAEIYPVAAAHTEYTTDVHGDHLYLGYVISIGGIRVYHSGDTTITRTLLDCVRALRPHIAVLPINGGDFFRTRRGIVGNMSAREAVDFACEVGVDLLIPNHYDMFPTNRDHPAVFVDYLFQHHRELKFHMFAIGERFLYFA